MSVFEEIPRYYLYGTMPATTEQSFLHVEKIEDHDDLPNWELRAHVHPDQHHLLVVTRGSGVLMLEDRKITFASPALITLPALTIHAFRWEPICHGYFITVSTALLTTALEGDSNLGKLFHGVGSTFQGEDTLDASLTHACASLIREYRSFAVGRRMAIKADLQKILVTFARRQNEAPCVVSSIFHRQTEIVRNLRELIEHVYTSRPCIPKLAAQLNVSSTRLNEACRSVVGMSALNLVHARLLVEAKRYLLYTSVSISAIAEMIGFEDAAYFNRFFSRRVGISPGAYRASRSPIDKHPSLPKSLSAQVGSQN